MKIPTAGLVIGKYSAHKHSADAIYALAQDLDIEGQKTPILVRPIVDGYEVIKGNRLAFAAIRLGWQEIEANIFPCDEALAFQLAFESNMERK